MSFNMTWLPKKEFVHNGIFKDPICEQGSEEEKISSYVIFRCPGLTHWRHFCLGVTNPMVELQKQSLLRVYQYWLGTLTVCKNLNTKCSAIQ